MLVVAMVITWYKMRGDDAMDNKIKEFVKMKLDILYTMSTNLAGGALLAKALQLE
ncbi:MAG: hypothetical protein K2N34_13985 [Lachnospiraceae bacterium]|nr:hypothetical protein [Lachnospiraceae bacterium]